MDFGSQVFSYPTQFKPLMKNWAKEIMGPSPPNKCAQAYLKPMKFLYKYRPLPFIYGSLVGGRIEVLKNWRQTSKSSQDVQVFTNLETNILWKIEELEDQTFEARIILQLQFLENRKLRSFKFKFVCERKNQTSKY